MTSRLSSQHPSQRTPWSGDVVIKVECRSEAKHASKVRHEIAIHDDMSVSTPHDLDAERVASAFGGYCSCVELVDQTLPQMQDILPRLARRARPELRRGKHLEWRVPTRELVACCSGRSYESVRMILKHMRSATHIAKLFKLLEWQVDFVARGVSDACRPDLGHDAPNARFVCEPDGLERLWQAGIHPDVIPSLASYASAVEGPLPVRYFEGAAYSGHDPGWVNEVLQYRPDADTAAWLVWQDPPDLISDATEWGRWLLYRVSRRDFLFAVRDAIPANLVMDVADATGWSKMIAARGIIDWGRAGCQPTLQHFQEIARRGMVYSTPGREGIDLAMAAVRGIDASIARTELGVMLALVGNQPELMAAVRLGARSVAGLTQYEPRPPKG